MNALGRPLKIPLYEARTGLPRLNSWRMMMMMRIAPRGRNMKEFDIYYELYFITCICWLICSLLTRWFSSSPSHPFLIKSTLLSSHILLGLQVLCFLQIYPLYAFLFSSLRARCLDQLTVLENLNSFKWFGLWIRYFELHLTSFYVKLTHVV